MEKLLQKEKELHKEIRADFEKISQKINDDFEKVKQSKSSQWNYPSLLIMWYPNSVFTGSEISPICSLNATSSNCFTIMPFVKYPKFPSFFPLPESIDNSFANFPNFSPFLSLSTMASDSLCFATRIWEHFILTDSVIWSFFHLLIIFL